MSKIYSALLLLSFLTLFAASCSTTETIQTQNISDNNDTSLSVTELPGDVTVDIDLTLLSSTMTFAEVYNIMMYPDTYLGKIIKGCGIYNCFYSEDYDRHFHYFIILDATGCCPQGLDFVWSGEHIYPDDYPDIGDTIEVTGKFVKGVVDGLDYYFLDVDDITNMSV